MRVAGQGSSRDRLLNAGKSLFAARGYDGTTTAAIAKAAGTSHSQLIKHFRDKRGLLQALLEAAWQQLGSAMSLAIERIGNPVERLRLVINMFLSAVQKDRQTAAVLMLDGGTVHEEDGRPLISGGYARFSAILDEIVEAMKLGGELRADVQPVAFRAALMACLEKFVRDRMVAAAVPGMASYSEAELQSVIFGLFAGCLETKVSEALEQPASSSIPLAVAGASDDEAWIRQYTGLAETLLKTPGGNA